MEKVRYHFASSASAWAFARYMAAMGSEVTDYGFDAKRSTNGFSIEVLESVPAAA